jgi:hypothetical protein
MSVNFGRYFDWNCNIFYNIDKYPVEYLPFSSCNALGMTSKYGFFVYF